jgi:hypothetical protein
MTWDVDENGNIIVAPVTGFAVAEAMLSVILTRLEFLSLMDGSEISGAAQLLLTPTQALEFAKLLRETAERILAQKGPAKPS